jgi:hypothetical protein
MDSCHEQSLYQPSHSSALHINGELLLSTNVFHNEDEIDNQEAPACRQLPTPLTNLISSLRSDGRFPDTSSNDFYRHSEIGTLQRWVASLGDDVELTSVSNTHPHEAVINTSFMPPFLVPACLNCSVVLLWLDIGDLHAGEAVLNEVEMQGSSAVEDDGERQSLLGQSSLRRSVRMPEYSIRWHDRSSESKLSRLCALNIEASSSLTFNLVLPCVSGYRRI